MLKRPETLTVKARLQQQQQQSQQLLLSVSVSVSPTYQYFSRVYPNLADSPRRNLRER